MHLKLKTPYNKDGSSPRETVSYITLPIRAKLITYCMILNTISFSISFSNNIL
jgi:ABC-type sugar transport system permease subunit